MRTSMFSAYASLRSVALVIPRNSEEANLVPSPGLNLHAQYRREGRWPTVAPRPAANALLTGASVLSRAGGACVRVCVRAAQIGSLSLSDLRRVEA